MRRPNRIWIEIIFSESDSTSYRLLDDDSDDDDDAVYVVGFYLSDDRALQSCSVPHHMAIK